MANRYVVAIANLFENTNEIQFVGADTELEAMRTLLKQETRKSLTNIPDDMIDTVEAVREFFFDADMLVSIPVKI